VQLGPGSFSDQRLRQTGLGRLPDAPLPLSCASAALCLARSHSCRLAGGFKPRVVESDLPLKVKDRTVAVRVDDPNRAKGFGPIGVTPSQLVNRSFRWSLGPVLTWSPSTRFPPSRKCIEGTTRALNSGGLVLVDHGERGLRFAFRFDAQMVHQAE
jgi:hypothetical protein